MAKVNIVDRLGDTYSVDEEKAQKYLDQGFTLQTKEQARQSYLESEYGGIGGQVAAGAAGVARGLTFGASDVAGKALGISKELGELKEAYPTTSTVAEVGSTIVPLLATGGTGALAKGAQGAGTLVRGAATAGEKIAAKIGTETAARKIAGQAISTAAEGALYGAGEYVSEYALGDEEFNAEKLLASMGTSAVVSGVAGAGFGATEAMAKKVVNKYMPKTGSAAFEGMRAEAREAAQVSALKATGARNGQIQKVLSDGKQSVGQRLIDEDIVTFGASDDVILERIQGKLKEAKKDLIEVRKEAIDFARANKEYQPTEDEIKDIVYNALKDDLESGLETQKKQARRVYDDLSSIWGGEKKLSKKELATQAERASQEAAGLLPKTPPKELDLDHVLKMRQEIDSKIWPKKGAVSGYMTAKESDVANLYHRARVDVEDYLKKRFETIMEAAGKSEKYRPINDRFADLSTAHALASKADLQNLGNRWLSPTDYLTGLGSTGLGILSAGPEGAVMGLAGALAHKFVRERGRAAVAVTADAIAKGKVLAGIEAQLAKTDARIEKAIGKLVLGGARATARAAEVATSKGVRRAAVSGVKTGEASAIKEAYEPGRLVAPITSKILETVKYSEQKPDESKSAYRRRLDELSALVSDPELLQKQLAKSMEPIGNTAPNIATQANIKATQAANFLHQKAPKPPQRTDTALGLPSNRWEPSRQELSKFARYVSAVEDPIGAIDALADGRASAESMEAIRAVYPRIHRDIVMNVLQKGEQLERMNFAQKVQLSLLLGVPLDETMRPGFVRAIQESYNYVSQEEEQATGMVKPTQGALREIDPGGRAMTHQQRLETR